MARLRNRIVKADFWSDPELLRWPREKRTTYQGLWATAEDSGCIEDDAFGWKLLLWPSPLDADITIEMLEAWRDEWVAARKLIPYEADGKSYLFVRTFHEHERPRNPQSPTLPLPPWVTYQTREVPRKDVGKGGTYTINEYIVDYSLIPGMDNRTVTVPLRHGTHNDTPVRSGPVQSGPVLKTFLTGDGEPPPSEEEDTLTAQTVVAFAVDRARESGAGLTDKVKGQLAKEVGKQFKAGADPLLVRAAVGELIERNKDPSNLCYVMRDLKGGGRVGAHSGRSQNGEW